LNYNTTCPNCKSKHIIPKWVEKSFFLPKEVDINEYGVNVIEEKVQRELNPHGGFTYVNCTSSIGTFTMNVAPTSTQSVWGITSSSGISSPPTKEQRKSLLNRYIQLVLSCSECGYTQVIDIDKYIVASEL
jgi:ribosomal protein L44E